MSDRPQLTLLTPTGDRPEAFELLERWIVQEQEIPVPWEWIVVDDGLVETRVTQGQYSIRNAPHANPTRSQAANLLAGIYAAHSDRILILEDDDYYAPGYIRQMLNWFQYGDLIGMVPARYYNVRSRRYMQMENRHHASLAQTGVQGPAIQVLKQACETAKKFIDLQLWDEFGGVDFLGEAALHVGIKGMPGRRGIASGHGLKEGESDRGGQIARSWGIPQDYDQFASV